MAGLSIVKSQDILLLLKLVSLYKQEQQIERGHISKAWPLDWQDWEVIEEEQSEPDDLLLPERKFGANEFIASLYTARKLEVETGISKSQINLSLNRCIEIGLAKKERKIGIPRANVRALFEFIVFGIKYVFPTKPQEITRGIATAFAAPVLKEKLMSTGEYVPIWPDAKGNTKGQAVEPLYKSAVHAVRRDPEMYSMLALVDAIRIGRPREKSLAVELLKQHLGVSG